MSDTDVDDATADDEADRTTVTISAETKARLDDNAPPADSWDERLRGLLDECVSESGSGSETDESGVDSEQAVRGDAAPRADTLHDMQETLRRVEELVDHAPERTADLLESRFGPRR